VYPLLPESKNDLLKRAGIGRDGKPQNMNGNSHTWREIQQQPALWPTTAARVREGMERLQVQARLKDARIVITGAGTSAYAAAIAAAWPGSVAVPSTDLLLAAERYIGDETVLLSVGRSGDSPESMAVVERVHHLRPEMWHLAVTCNPHGGLATSPLVNAIVLDPRTNDESLVMTSSFSNLLLAGLCLIKGDCIEPVIASAAAAAQTSFAVINDRMRLLANRTEDRVLILASPPLFSWAQEGALKVLEMTAGRFPVMAETYLGLRHGPMSFVRPNTQVICLMSNDRESRAYEEDLVRELGVKKLGYLVGICNDDSSDHGIKLLFDEVIPALLPQTLDDMRTPFEILGVQLLGYHLSLRVGLNPDSPSPGGVINRVAQGIRIYH
jgi:tagatose-6-phosphate ketose/aldose isomerase